MFQARGSEELIIIDASRTGSEPGAIYQVSSVEQAAEIVVQHVQQITTELVNRRTAKKLQAV